jgi:integrase
MQTLFKLTAKEVAAIRAPGRYSDGGNLYLQVAPKRRSWVLFYRSPLTGKMREMGLGAVVDTSLAEAREKAKAARKLIEDGTDPLEDRMAKRAVRAGAKTFGEFVQDLIGDDETPGTALQMFRNEKHRYQWRQTLTNYCKPLWPMALKDITKHHVHETLKAIWDSKRETAKRTRGRLERVFAAAKAQGLRDGENPAIWKDNLQPLLDPFGTIKKQTKKHYPAIPFAELPAFMKSLRSLKGVSALALEFTILTAARSGETRLMRWDEYDAKAKMWTVPASRMKMGVEHRVPLSDRAIAILENIAPKSKRTGLVFKGAKPGEPLSDAALLECLRGIRPGFTVHGCRSSFRDYIGEKTHYPDSLAEFALAHKIADEVQAAYRRGDGLEKRFKMMQDWADYLA